MHQGVFFYDREEVRNTAAALRPSPRTDSRQEVLSINMNVKRGELYYADLSPVVGSEQGGIHPVLVVQNDVGNKYSPTVIAAAVTSKIHKARLPTHIELPSAYGLAKDSVILLEQIRTIDKRRLKERIGELPSSTMNRVNKAILISLGFNTSE